jgi:hypothetical protein
MIHQSHIYYRIKMMKHKKWFKKFISKNMLKIYYQTLNFLLKIKNKGKININIFI